MSYPPYGAPGGYPPQQPGGYPPYQAGPFVMPGSVPYPPQPYGIGFQNPGYPSSDPYPPQSGGFPTPGYPPAPGGYQQPGIYPSQAGGYPPAPGFAPAPGGYPPAPGAYPPSQGAYPTAPGGYPPAQGAYPPAQGGYPPAQGGYPPAQGGYPPTQAPGGYPQTQAPGGYPPTQAGYPPAQGAYPPAQGAHPPAQGAYPPSLAQPLSGVAPSASFPAAQAGAMPAKIVGQGTVRPYGAFNAEEDCKILRKAMKGIGTDEKAIIEVLARCNNEQRQKTKLLFKTMYGKDLINELKSELSGHFEQCILGLMLTPSEYDAEQLRNAMKGAGTDEACLIEILCTRTNKEIADIKAAYKLKFSRDLEKDLMSETSGHFRRLLVALSTGNRMENVPLDPAKARQDATELFQAGEKKLGTDESKFNQILCSQSYEQLRLVFQEYQNIAHKSLEQSIKSEMSGDLERGMLAILRSVMNKHAYFAERLYHSMKGAGTKDQTLIRVVITRCEIDMVQIKQEHQRQFGKTVEALIEGDTSGDYKRVLLALVRG